MFLIQDHYRFSKVTMIITIDQNWHKQNAKPLLKKPHFFQKPVTGAIVLPAKQIVPSSLAVKYKGQL